MSNIALLGPAYLVNPLKACGINIYSCDSGPQGSAQLKDILAHKQPAIIFITERLARELPEEIAAAEEKDINIVLLPDHRGSLGLYREKLKGLIHD